MKKIVAPAEADTRQLLTSLQTTVKATLTRGFQFLFHLLRNSENSPEANVSLFLQKDASYESVLNSRSGKLLCVLTESPGYKALEGTKENGDSLTSPTPNKRMAFRQMQTLDTPFLRKQYHYCVPRTLLQDSQNDTSISEYLDDETAGIHHSFRKKQEILNPFLEMHALLYELGTILLVCEDAFLVTEIEGEILLHPKCNQQLTLLLDLLKKLCDAISQCQKKCLGHAQSLKKDLDKNAPPQTPEDTAWLNNFTQFVRVHSPFWQAIAACLKQASVLKEKAARISPREDGSETKPETDSLAAAIERLNQHLCNIPTLANALARKPSAEVIALFGIRRPTGTQVVRFITGDNLLLIENELKSKPNATELLIQKNGIKGTDGPQLCEWLKPMLKLRTLIISGNVDLFSVLHKGYICALAFSRLLQTLQLTHLRVDECGLDSAGAKLLSKGLGENRSLALLDLSHNKIDDEATITLCAALTNHPTLCLFHIDGNDITDEGGLALLKLAEDNPRITTLEVKENRISTALCERIERQIEANQEKAAAVCNL